MPTSILVSTHDCACLCLHLCISYTSPLRGLIDFFAHCKLTVDPPTVFVDNQPLIDAINSMSAAQTKHIAIRLNLMRDLVQQGIIRIQFIPTQLQLADCLTKPVQHKKFTEDRDSLDIA